MFQDTELVKTTKRVLEFVKHFSEKINFFIPNTFFVLPKEKVNTILLDPGVIEFLREQASAIGYSEDFIDEFFENCKQRKRARFKKGKSDAGGKLRKQTWMRNQAILGPILELGSHKPIEQVDFESDLILDISVHQFEAQKIFCSLSVRHYIDFHQAKGLPLRFPFMGFKHLALKLKPNFGNHDYDENKLKVKYTKIKIMASGELSLARDGLRLLQAGFQTVSANWVSFVDGNKTLYSEMEKEKEQTRVEKSQRADKLRVSMAEPETAEKKMELLATNKVFAKKQTYMKRSTVRRNSQFEKSKGAKHRQFQVCVQPDFGEKNQSLEEGLYGKKLECGPGLHEPVPKLI